MTISGEKTALLFLGGEVFLPNGLLPQIVNLASLIVAADGGLRHAIANHIPVDVLIGDLDSVWSEQVESAVAAEMRVILQPDQNSTDFEKALVWLETEGFRKVIILGFAGGRSDHAFVNFSILRNFASKFSSLVIHDFENEMQILLPEHGVTELRREPGTRVSLLPLPEAGGISATGFEWPILDGTLGFGAQVSLSNRIDASGVARIAFKSGALLMAIERDAIKRDASEAAS